MTIKELNELSYLITEIKAMQCEFLAELIKRNPSTSRSTAQRWLNEAGYQSDQEKGKQTGKPSVWHKKIDTNYY